MKRHEAVKIISQHFRKDDLIVSSTGNLSRELAIISDLPQIFYMMGSMGLTSSIGLGLAVCLPNQRIIIIEGDGSVLMNMGSMATIGHYAPSNLIHIVLDNEAYDSTGGQPSVSNTANLDKLAEAAGYNTVRKVVDKDELERIFEDDIKSLIDGPIFIQVKIEMGGISERIPRVPYEPEEITNRLKNYCGTLEGHKKNHDRKGDKQC